MSSSPFAPPTELQVYDSYDVDPKWQRYYTWAWVALMGTFMLASIPYLVRTFKNGTYKKGWMITESNQPVYSPTSIHPEKQQSVAESGHENKPTTTIRNNTFQKYRPVDRFITATFSVYQTVSSYHIPLPFLKWSIFRPLRWLEKRDDQTPDCCREVYMGMTVGKLILLALYFSGFMVTILKDSKLEENANRPGFMALAMLTPLFILLTKNNPLGLILGTSYVELNWAHRWVGRIIWLSTTVHGTLWIDFYRKNDRSMLSHEKSLRGYATWILLTVLAISSVRIVRRKYYHFFWYMHIITAVGFFTAMCYHTPTYCRPWIFPPVALFTADLFFRMCRFNLKDAALVALDDNMTMIHIPECDDGWLPTQHVRIRVLAQGVVFEGHPLTITSAPGSSHQDASCPSRGITLYAKVVGDWSRKMNRLAKQSDMSARYERVLNDLTDPDTYSEDCDSDDEDDSVKQAEASFTPVKVLIDGPYGGLKLDMANYQNVLIIAGGSGITFALGAIQECLRRKAQVGDRGGASRVQIVWAVKDMSSIQSMAHPLSHLYERAMESGAFEIEYHMYLTRPPTPLPEFPPGTLPPNTTLSPYRPMVSQIVRETLPAPTLPELEEGKGIKTCCTHGGLAVLACGPVGIVSESENAVAGLSLSERVRVGGADFYGECFAI